MFGESIMDVRIHGRGGQGVVMTATIMAEIAFRSGYFPQAFPFFGAERRGAPVVAFLRYSRSFLMPRSRIYEPFCVVSFDTKLPQELILEGLKNEGKVLLNDLESSAKGHLTTWPKATYVVNASHIAREYGMVSSGMPLVSSIMIGALSRILGLGSEKIVEESLKGRFSQFETENIRGALRGYREVKETH